MIGGLTEDDYYADEAANALSFKETVVTGIGFGTVDNVINLKVTQNTRRRRLTQEAMYFIKNMNFNHRILQNSGLLFSYTISAILGQDNNFTGPNQLYNSAVQSLNQSVIDGSFQNNLQAKGNSFR